MTREVKPLGSKSTQPIESPSETKVSRHELRARLVELTGSRTGRVHRLTHPDNVIGRDPVVGSGVQLEEDDVSRRHARIFRRGEFWVIEDMGSRNGTLLNGEFINEAKILSFGDHLQFGGRILCVFTYYDQLEEQIHQVQRMESMGALVSGVAHDFNNILSVMIGNVDYLDHCRQDGALDEAEVEELLAEMRQASAQAEELVRQLMRFSRPSTSGATVVDCSRLIKEATDLCRRTFGPKIELIIDVTLDLRVYAESGQLNQILMNLLINARDSMREGGKIEVSAKRRVIEGADMPFLSAGPYICIEVGDSGSGMDEETRQRVFEPFFTTKKSEKGTGLGLSTVYSLVRKLGGYINVRSELGKGSTFSLYLPAIQTGRHHVVTQPADKSICRAAHTLFYGMPRVLLVDDDEAVLRTTSRLLQKIGFDVCTAASGEEAVEIFEKEKDEIQLVLLDVLMPGLDGARTFGLLRKIDPSIRVLFISGHVEAKSVDSFIESGACGFLPKPCSANNLKEAIDAVLAAH